MGRVAFPFLTLLPDHVRAGPWRVSLNGAPEEDLKETLDHWDYNSGLLLSRTLELNTDAAVRQLQIDRDYLFGTVFVRIGTGEGRLPRLIVHSEAVPVSYHDPQCTVNIHLTSERLAEALHLVTDVVLATRPENAGRLSPREPGCRIWSDEKKVWLEGERPRFPMSTAPLEEAVSPWKLYWDPAYWAYDFHGAVNLVINERREDILERIRNKDRLTLEAALADTISQILETLLAAEDPERIVADAEPGTLADVAGSWIETMFPGGGIAAARNQLEVDPGAFRAKVWTLAEIWEK